MLCSSVGMSRGEEKNNNSITGQLLPGLDMRRSITAAAPVYHVYHSKKSWPHISRDLTGIDLGNRSDLSVARSWWSNCQFRHRWSMSYLAGLPWNWTVWCVGLWGLPFGIRSAQILSDKQAESSCILHLFFYQSTNECNLRLDANCSFCNPCHWRSSWLLCKLHHMWWEYPEQKLRSTPKINMDPPKQDCHIYIRKTSSNPSSHFVSTCWFSLILNPEIQTELGWFPLAFGLLCGEPL